MQKVPDCPRAISDQFGTKRSVSQALMKLGKGIKLEQRHKAEADVAVAAASILARDAFVKGIKKLGDEIGMVLPKGASKKVDEVGRELVAKQGEEVLGRVAKVHFRTTQKVLGTISE